MNSGGYFGTLIITLVILVVLFLIMREVVCWYWKINQNLALLTEIRDLLAAQKAAAATPTMPGAKALPPTGPHQAVSPVVAQKTGPTGTCPNCSAQIALSAEECPKCKASFGAGSAWKVRPN